MTDETMPDEIFIDTDRNDNRYSLKDKSHRTKYIRADKVEGLRVALEMSNAVFDMFMSVETGDVGAVELSGACNKAMEMADDALAVFEKGKVG